MFSLWYLLSSPVNRVEIEFLPVYTPSQEEQLRYLQFLLNCFHVSKCWEFFKFALVVWNESHANISIHCMYFFQAGAIRKKCSTSPSQIAQPSLHRHHLYKILQWLLCPAQSHRWSCSDGGGGRAQWLKKGQLNKTPRRRNVWWSNWNSTNSRLPHIFVIPPLPPPFRQQQCSYYPMPSRESWCKISYAPDISTLPSLYLMFAWSDVMNRKRSSKSLCKCLLCVCVSPCLILSQKYCARRQFSRFSYKSHTKASSMSNAVDENVPQDL